MIYIEINAAHNRVNSLAGLDGFNNNKEEYIDELLNLSAGTQQSITVFRPFLVAAMMLSQDLDTQALSEASGVTFTGLQKPIESLLGLQKSYDISNALEIPLGFDADSFLDRLCGCGSGGNEDGYSGGNIMSAFVV